MPFTLTVQLAVNQAQHRLEIDPRSTLLDVLRERLGLCGTKKGCDHGQCGACTVHVDGRRVVSCLSLAIQTQGKQITTIEGVGSGDTLDPRQQNWPSPVPGPRRRTRSRCRWASRPSSSPSSSPGRGPDHALSWNRSRRAAGHVLPDLLRRSGVALPHANAVFHATGIRVRDLPIRIEKLLPREAGAAAGS